MGERIGEHNQRPASVWSSGGDAYNDISQQIASALDHCVCRIDPQPGERMLDLGTGTGWTSRLLARRCAKVTGADIASDLVAAAGARAKAEGLDIEYDIADAERLPYRDGGFDAVVSTFGVMFASRPEAAAAELARVCRRGGRIGLTTWAPQGNVYKMFVMMGGHTPASATPPPPTPFAWGNRDRLQELLGSHFDLKFEEGVTTYYDRDGEAAWKVFAAGYGPTKALAGALDEVRRTQLQRAFAAFHDAFATPLGIAVPREYLLTVGVRR